MTGKRMIASDETKINRICSDGILHLWLRPSNVLMERQVQPTQKYDGGCIMVWGCFTWAGVGKLALVRGRMDSQQYIEILEQNLLPTMDAYMLLPDAPKKEDLIFQQDNDSKHRSKLTKQWFDDKNLRPMDWPACSPDLNPIEHLWAILKRKMGTYREPPKGVHELWARVQTEWVKIEREVCQRLIESMPMRVKAVIRAKGGPTKY